MGSESTLTLPVIDFSLPDLTPGTPNYNLVKSQVLKALEEFGCFNAVLKFREQLHNSVFTLLEELFNLPSEVKERIAANIPFWGYTAPSPTAPLCESFGFVDPTTATNVDRFINIAWPEGNSDKSKILYSYSSIVVELQELIRRMILESLGIEKYMDEQVTSTEYGFKLLKYHAPSSSEKKLGLKAHCDKNVLTILHDNQVGGLEVQSKDGQWVSVETTPNSFIVFAGESFAAWTNDRLYATPHRVIMAENTERFCLGMFSSYTKGYIVKAPEELVDKEHPLRYKPFEFYEFIKDYQKQFNTEFLSVKSYYGV